MNTCSVGHWSSKAGTSSKDSEKKRQNHLSHKKVCNACMTTGHQYHQYMRTVPKMWVRLKSMSSIKVIEKKNLPAWDLIIKVIKSVINIKKKSAWSRWSKRKKSACIRAGFCCIAENPPCPCSSLQSIWIDRDGDDSVHGDDDSYLDDGDGDHDDDDDLDDLDVNGNDDYETLI